MKHYDIAVLGDELAGTWLLKKLSSVGKIRPLRVLWIRTNSEYAVHRLPLSLAEHFAIPFEQKWSLELAFPSKVFLWDSAKIDSYFTGSNLKTADLLNPETKLQRVSQHLLKTFADLTTISKGVWAYLGYTEKLSDESKVWASLLCREMVEWDISNEKTLSALDSIFIPETAQLNVINVNSKLIELEFENHEKISTNLLFLNAELSRLKSLLSENNFKKFGFDEEIFSDYAKYSLQLDFEANTYLPFQKSCILYSTDGVPEVCNEISILERVGSRVYLQIYERRNASLDAVLNRFKTSVRDLSRGYPELHRKIKSFYPPLGLETCYSDTFRTTVLHDLTRGKRDLYRLSQVTSETAYQSIKNVSPSIHCHLPYPYGPLIQASKHLSDYI